jgi:hypothetical protein
MKRIINLNDHQIKILQGYLDMQTFHPDYGELAVLWERSVKLDEYYEVDIQIVNAEGPYINAVLFFEGCEIHTLDPTWDLISTFEFATDEDGKPLTFQVEVRRESNTEAFLKEYNDRR